MDKSTRTTKKYPSGGCVSVPVVMQMENAECGAACLGMILSYYDCWVPISRLRLDCGISRNGSNAANILHAARTYGLNAAAFRMEPEELRNSDVFPCIIHWNFNHFVVLDGFKGSKAVLNDPAKGIYTVSAEVFDRCFTGVCLVFEPREDFEPSGKRISMNHYARERLSGAKAAVIFVMITTFISLVLGIIAPTLKRVFVDWMLSYNDRIRFPFIIAISVYSLMNILLAWISVVYLTRVKGRLGTVGCTGYLWHVMHLPMEFFSQRMVGSIDSRKTVNADISYEMLMNLAPLGFDALMILVYLIVMSNYSSILTLIGVSSIAIKLFLASIISRRRINITRVQLRNENHLVGVTVSGFDMIETIKSSGSENGFFDKWAGIQADTKQQMQNNIRLSGQLGALPRLLTGAVDAIILTIGVILTMGGEFTPGMILGFQALMNEIANPVDQVISSAQSFTEMRTQMEQVEDVMSYPEDRRYTRTGLNDDESYTKLTGAVEMKDVTFGYSRLERPVIKNFSLSLKPGRRIAIVGPSGCGKSTIGKLIAGLYLPWSGDVLYDGKHIDEIDHGVFCGSMAVADQDITLFKDTIENNIKMWDSSIEDFEMILAARDAMAHDVIMQRDGGYQYVIEDDGRDLSGGERQKLEIARILALDPTIVILDEATSAMDSMTESAIMNAICQRGITCVIIAHRLSTIRDCDEIIVLNYGEVVERGTHEELFAKNGFYTQLVTNA